MATRISSTGAPFDGPILGAYNGRVRVFSGANGALIYDWFGGTGAWTLGYSVANAGDANGDGHPDVVAGAPSSVGSVILYSGATGAILHFVPAGMSSGGCPPAFGESVSTAGDADGDGMSDVLVGARFAVFPGAGCPGTATVVSGRTGLPLYVFGGAPASNWFGMYVSGGHNVAGNANPDIAVTSVTASVGSVMVFNAAGPTAAWSRTVGTGCGPATATPALAMDPPRLGLNISIGLSSAPPSAGGILFVSAPAAGLTPIGTNCTLALDLWSVMPFINFGTTSAGVWNFSYALPSTPAWAGANLSFQAALFPAATPLGVALTNGVNVQLGW